MKKIVKNLAFLVLLPIYIFLLLIKKYFAINLYTYDCSRYGNCVAAPEIFLKKFKKVYQNHFTIIFLKYKNEPSNKFVVEKYCELFRLNKIKVIRYNLFISALDFCHQFTFKKKFSVQLEVNRKYFGIYKSKQIFKLTNAEIEKGFEILKKFNVKKNSKWICVHNRDKSFLENFHGYQSWKYHDYRDFSVNDYELAIKLFIKKGFFVFRIGKGSNHQLQISKKNKKVIDLTRHNLRTDFLEVFLINNCSFYLGTSSGPIKAARMLRKKIFLVNVCPLESVFVEDWNFPVIFKKAFYFKKKRYLTIKEILKEDIHNCFEINILKSKKIKLINNSRKEILEYSKEIFKYLKFGRFIYNKAYLVKRKKFNNLIIQKRYLKKMKYKNPIGQNFFKSVSLH